ncbi:MAG: hypothetical protein HRU19_19980 [Pseudobacteriovorax sp.]|nr:hypothetical protein [Pseudobacteriovorax sp.]
MQYLFFIILTISSNSVLLAARAIEVSELGDLQGRPLGHYTEWLKAELDFKAVIQPKTQNRFLRGTSPILNLGFNPGTIWYKLELINSSSSDQTLYFADSRNYTRIIEVYFDSKIVGQLHPEQTLNKRYLSFVVPALHQGALLVRTDTEMSRRNTFSLWHDRSALGEANHNTEKVWYFLKAVFVMSLLFNAMLYLAYKSRVYLHYMGYTICMTIFGYWLWSVIYIESFPSFTLNFGFAIGGFAGFFACMFVGLFLDLKNRSPRSEKILRWLGYAHIPIFLLASVSPSLSAKYGTVLNLSWSFAGLLISAYIFFLRKELYVLLFIAAFGVVMLAVSVQQLIWMGVVPIMTNHLVFYGMALENILMLASMGYKIFSKEKDRVGKHKELLHNYEQMKKVFFQHQIDMIQKGRSLEQTMPVGSQDAYVLCFDVVSSSKINSAQLSHMIENFFSCCRQSMMQGYEAQSMQSRAYMIKEMGDGFFCSIGYPFHSHAENLSSDAYALAREFLGLFHEKCREFALPSSTTCAIGIAKGRVNAYFTTDGVVRHDIWGKAVVLANRYESASRKIIALKSLTSGSMIVMQRDVFENLPQEEQQSLKIIEANLVPVRDDEESSFLAYLHMDQSRLEEQSLNRRIVA